MISSFAKIRTSIRLNVVSVCIVATVLTAGLATGLQYYFGQALARQAAADLYTSVSAGVAAKLRGVGTLNANIIDLLDDNPILRDPALERRQIELFTDVLQRNPLYYGIYLGRGDGTFFEVINLEIGGGEHADLQVQASDRWLVINVGTKDAGRERRYRYLDADLQERLVHTESTDFEVTSRPWYSSAMSAQTLQISDPYLFAQLGAPGRTLSKALPRSDTVVAIDMTLATVSEFLASQAISEHSAIYLFSGNGQVITSSDSAGQSDDLAATAQAADIPAVPKELLAKIAANPQLQDKLFEAQLNGKSHLIYSAAASPSTEKPLFVGIVSPLDAVIAPFLDKVKLSIGISAGLLLLLLPLSWVIANPIVRPVKQLEAENDKVRRREYDDVAPVKTRVRELNDLSHSMVDMVSSIQAHEQAQRELMDAIIELIAQAIDDKSAYTGGHCERVPELAMLLAEQASDSDLPAFADFKLEHEDQWREYRIAAWLHDCGKITTPEHIVDKGSKLELIYNRIHEVRMRFEVLWRDVEIQYWKSLTDRHDEHGEPTRKLREDRQKLQDDFAFVAQCNVGGEYLDPEKHDRLLEIAKTTWQRHFDDRIGLSPVEQLRCPPRPATLPATEQLLADKPEHVIERTRSTDYPPQFGIDMQVPEHLYNQGELYNLSISRGTLTEEDRFKINEHMISTIKMLESLPFPQELKNVPRYASTHHETMKGSGYPRKLPGSALSIPERILAVADIFEALTASDRPYKKAKPISEAVRILHQMVLDNHVDKDCFELFLSSGTYLEYAQRFLADEQRDDVDIAGYLGA